MTDFQSLGLSDAVLQVLENMGFTTPTPIQQQAIPLLLAENSSDFIGLAQTGTGKTAAFGLPLVDLIDEGSKELQAIIMAPTRELGQQTGKQLVSFASGIKKMNVEVVYGGAPIVNQIKALRKPTQIVTATPGRLLDLIKRKALDLSTVKYVILDEADEMLNMGFKEDIDEILAHTPENRVTWLFSATMPEEIRRIVKKYMSNPAEVRVNSKEKSNKDISHKYVVTKGTNKVPALKRFVDMQPDMRAVMFCRTKRETQEIADQLAKDGYGAEALHGDLSQAQRDSVMKKFKANRLQLLIATDVAARGIDVNDLSHVFHHTLPDQLESYTHRSGRTGRAGKKGTSLAFINGREGRKIKDLERKINVTFEQVTVPDAGDLMKQKVALFVERMQSTDATAVGNDIADALEIDLLDLDKKLLLKKAFSLLMMSGSQSNDTENLNESMSYKNSSDSSSSRNGYTNYFINLGNVDGFSKPDLLNLLVDLSRVEASSFGEIRVLNNRSYFEVNDSSIAGLESKFEGIEIKGREIRVNKDSGRPPKSGGNKYSRGRSKTPQRNFRKGRGKRR